MLKVKFCSNPAASPPPGVFGSDEVVVFVGFFQDYFVSVSLRTKAEEYRVGAAASPRHT